VTLAAYNGHEPLTFTDYLDLGTGKTLHAEPGVVYDVAPASGRVVPDMPEPWFTPVSPAGGVVTASAGLAGEGAAAEGDAAPGSSSDEEAGGEPAHDEDEHSAF
jgi:hypothetical protein